MKSFITIAVLAVSASVFADPESVGNAYLVLPNVVQEGRLMAPYIQMGDKRLVVSEHSSEQAKSAIGAMYNNAGGFRLVEQTASMRKFAVQVAGKCFDHSRTTSSLFGFYEIQIYKDKLAVCQNDSQFWVESLYPVSAAEVVLDSDDDINSPEDRSAGQDLIDELEKPIPQSSSAVEG